MFWAKANASVFVFALVVIAESITARFDGRRVVEPNLREKPSGGLHAHHGGAFALVRYNRHLEPSVRYMVLVLLARDIVGVNAIMREETQRLAPAAGFKLVDVIGQDLAHTFDVIQNPDFPLDELDNPDGVRVRFRPGPTNVPIGSDGKHGISG